MTNPFFAASPLPYGLPPFADITDEHYRPAFLRGFAEQLAEVELILDSTEPPTVENLLVPLERSGQLLDRVSAVFYNKASSDSSDFTGTLEEELAPLMAAHHDSIVLNPRLYERIALLHRDLPRSAPDAETGYLIERYFAEFTIAGAGLSAADRERLTEYNKTLSTLTTRFEKNLLAD